MTDRKTVDRYAKVMMKAWYEAEGESVSASYVATFADVARAVVEEMMVTDIADARAEAYSDGYSDGYSQGFRDGSW